jgi:seryl-tRNA synthetase
MTKNAYSEKITGAQVMVSGLNNHLGQLERRGISVDFIDRLSAETTEAVKLNNEQEKLKADLKAKTARLNDKLAEVAKLVAEAKKIVKLDVPKDQWKEFGIADKA